MQNQNNQGRQTRVTPAIGSQYVESDSGRIMYITRKLPPTAIERHRKQDTIHIAAYPAVGSRTGIWILEFYIIEGGQKKDKPREREYHQIIITIMLRLHRVCCRAMIIWSILIIAGMIMVLIWRSKTEI